LYDPGPPAGVHDLAAPRPGAATVALGDGDLVEIGDPSRAATAAVAPSRPSGTKVVLGTAETITLPKAGPPFVDRDERPEPATPTPSSSTSLLVAALPEKILGRYRVVAELGRGAMGVVLRAHDENLERDVAIKALTQTVRAYPDAIRLFASEAKALAHLNHPNIVAIYDQAVERSEAYLIMELVEGQTLEKLLHQRGPIPPPIALGLIDQLCAGLAYAHGKSVIHRDIKPANIFVTRDGTVKLGDFGLARVMHEVSIRQTEVRGTPLYMSPEQVVGEDIDHRADLYAVGCTLFELLTGKPPFAEGQVLFLHLTAEPPPPSTLRAELPPAIDELVLALLQKVAGDRPPNAADVRRRIAAILPTLPKAG
jgi:serine/threonine-protein kinase